MNLEDRLPARRSPPASLIGNQPFGLEDAVRNEGATHSQAAQR
jgi:hypothetical protein